MSPAALVLAHIRAMESYVPGLQINEPGIIKLNSNENPFPASPAVRAALLAALDDNRLQLYPDPRSLQLRAALAARAGRGADHVIVANGSDEALNLLFRATLGAGDRLVFADPTYSLYPILANMQCAVSVPIRVRADWRVDLPAMLTAARSAKLAILVNPGAPTGLPESRADLLEFARENPGLTLIDEAYIAFGGESVADVAGSADYPRLLVTGTFSKAYSLAGQRIGWLLAHPDLIRELDKLRDSYNVSRLAQVAALAALNDEAELQRRVALLRAENARLQAELGALGFETIPGQANFILTRPPESIGAGARRALEAAGAGASSADARNAAELYYRYLKHNNVLIRYFASPPCTEHVRISIGSTEQMDRVLELTRRLR